MVGQSDWLPMMMAMGGGVFSTANPGLFGQRAHIDHAKVRRKLGCQVAMSDFEVGERVL
jgi:hypothetical protein